MSGEPGAGLAALQELATQLAPYSPPVVVFNVAHSGSRLLAAALADAGLFLGAELNDSFDAMRIVPLVRYVVERHVPDFSRVFSDRDDELLRLVRQAIEGHLERRPPEQRWGWKLCETVCILPVLAVLFPEAQFIHLIRDGRDVAFSPFVSPKDPFWRKVYFNTDCIDSWQGLAMTQRAYAARGPVFNAARWVNGVGLGRAYGAMLGSRYREVRYEDLVSDLTGTLSPLLEWLNVSRPPTARALPVHADSVGKWRRQPREAIDAVMAVLEPTLAALAYSDAAKVPAFRRDPWWRRLFWA